MPIPPHIRRRAEAAQYGKEADAFYKPNPHANRPCPRPGCGHIEDDHPMGGPCEKCKCPGVPADPTNPAHMKQVGPPNNDPEYNERNAKALQKIGPVGKGEAQARLRKAFRIKAVLVEAGATKESVQSLTEQQWQMAAAAARCNLPSNKTREIVIALFQKG